MQCRGDEDALTEVLRSGELMFIPWGSPYLYVVGIVRCEADEVGREGSHIGRKRKGAGKEHSSYLLHQSTT